MAGYVGVAIPVLPPARRVPQSQQSPGGLGVLTRHDTDTAAVRAVHEPCGRPLTARSLRQLPSYLCRPPRIPRAVQCPGTGGRVRCGRAGTGDCLGHLVVHRGGAGAVTDQPGGHLFDELLGLPAKLVRLGNPLGGRPDLGREALSVVVVAAVGQCGQFVGDLLQGGVHPGQQLQRQAGCGPDLRRNLTQHTVPPQHTRRPPGWWGAARPGEGRGPTLETGRGLGPPVLGERIRTWGPCGCSRTGGGLVGVGQPGRRVGRRRGHQAPDAQGSPAVSWVIRVSSSTGSACPHQVSAVSRSPLGARRPWTVRVGRCCAQRVTAGPG